MNSRRVPWSDGHIVIEINRNNILDESIRAFQKLKPRDFMKTFRFKFIGEVLL